MLSWNKQIRNKIIQKSKKVRNSPLMLLAAKLHPGNGMGHSIFFIIQPMLKLEYRLQTMGIESWDHWASIKVGHYLFFQPKDQTNHKKNINYNFPANFIFVTLARINPWYNIILTQLFTLLHHLANSNGLKNYIYNSFMKSNHMIMISINQNMSRSLVLKIWNLKTKSTR